MAFQIKHDCCFGFYVHYKLREVHSIASFFYTKRNRYAAYLYILIPLEKQVRLTGF